MRSRTLSVNGSAVQIWESGADNARAILLIHGGLGDAPLYWSAIADLLAESYHVFAPDLPGYGGSELLTDLNMAAVLEWHRGLLQALDLPQVVLIGSSLGALIARMFAAAYPQTVPALVLVAGGETPSLSPLRKALLKLPVFGSRIIASYGRGSVSRAVLEKQFFDKSLPTDRFAESSGCNGDNFTRLVQAFTFQPLPDARQPQVPTLLVWGTADQVSPLKEAEALQAQLPGAALIQLDNCGHLPQIEAPDVFVFQVTAFLDRIERPTARRLPGVGMLDPSRLKDA